MAVLKDSISLLPKNLLPTKVPSDKRVQLWELGDYLCPQKKDKCKSSLTLLL